MIPYIVLPTAFTKQECDHIRSLGDALQLQDAFAYDAPLGYRIGKRAPIADLWLYNQLDEIISHVNDEHFKCNLTGFKEMVQYLRYDVGGRFGWHKDEHDTRELSFTVQLSDPIDYDGGRFEVFAETKTIPANMGTMVVFPSWVLHRVTEVTRGTRYALVGWVHGDVRAELSKPMTLAEMAKTPGVCICNTHWRGPCPVHG